MKKILTNWRIILLVVLLIISVILIKPTATEGLAIRAVEINSPASIAGLTSPDGPPLSWETVSKVNGQDILTIEQYYDAIINGSNSVETNENIYLIESNGSLGIDVIERPSTNVRTGLDLQGGSRLLLTPTEDLNQRDFDILKTNLEQRLNVFGLSDIKVSGVSDTFGSADNFILIELAGSNTDAILSVISKEGKFEAQILNKTVFVGEEVNVIINGQQAPTAAFSSCQNNGGEWGCQYQIPVALSADARKAQADATRNLAIQGQSLSEPIVFYLDGELVTSLTIAASLRGQAADVITISGGGSGPTQQAAYQNTLARMQEMQAVLQSGSLPSTLDVVKIDTISATLGSAFLQNAILVLGIAALSVSILVFIRYRSLKVAIPMILISLSEVVILLGAAVLLQIDLDLAGIAGIIIIVGTGFDHLIIITDEIGKHRNLSYKRRLRKGMGIIMTAFATTFVAMFPLLFSGAGLLKGFAIFTMIGLIIGIFVTRPAYAVIAEYVQ